MNNQIKSELIESYLRRAAGSCRTVAQAAADCGVSAQTGEQFARSGRNFIVDYMTHVKLWCIMSYKCAMIEKNCPVSKRI